MFCVVAYDIPDNRRRAKLFKAMKGFGIHTQFSVFECQLTEPNFLRMLSAIETLIKHNEDDIKVYVLCRDCMKTIKLIGTASLTHHPDCLIF